LHITNKKIILMKTIFTIILAFATLFTGTAQTFITQAKPYGEKLWGYINEKGGTVIEPAYKKCYPFARNGLAPIYESKKFQFINTKGEVLKTDINGFKLIEGFVGIGGLQGYSDGLVAVQKNKGWGFLNTNGGVEIMLKYDKVSSFNDGFAVAQSGGTYYVINKKGEELKIEGAEIANIKGFNEGMAPFADNSKKYGFINTDAKVAIEAQFASVGNFYGGLAWAKTFDKKVGFINTKGEWAVNPHFFAAKNFDPVSGLARVKTEEGWVYTDNNGMITKVTVSESWGDFHEGLAKGKKEGKTGYFNAKGEWAIEPQFEGGRNFKNGFAAVKQGGKWGFIDKTGNWVVEPNYSGVKDMELVK
jgi:hypothetical protein